MGFQVTLLHPSRSRAAKAFTTANKWLEEANVATQHIFSIDNSDPQADQYRGFDMTVRMDNSCVVEAVNHAAKSAVGDVLIYISDDVLSYPNWGQDIKRICERYTGEYMIKVSDGLQPRNAEVLTFPIMSKALYQRLGYFFHPSYKSMWVDVDLYHTCNNLGVIKHHPEILFEHCHYVNKKAPMDETYRRSDAHFETGRLINANRARQGYPI